MFRNIIYIAYSAVSYVAFLAVTIYLIGFLNNFGVPNSIDSIPTSSLAFALFVNIGLFVLFGLQHSVMARPAFKKWWSRYVPDPIERSTYVLLSSVALGLLLVCWQPIGGVIWSVENQTAKIVLWSIAGAGWTLLVASTFLINHFDLFGLRQTYLHAIGKPYTPLKLATPWIYRQVRHPLYVGWLIGFWVTPTMTVAHFLIAALSLAYILTGIRYEEKDLVDAHGSDYTRYREEVPMLVPSVGKRSIHPIVHDATR
jgi:protein-S-isoprenylcysteine O-methyltransferase Ste14